MAIIVDLEETSESPPGPSRNSKKRLYDGSMVSNGVVACARVSAHPRDDEVNHDSEDSQQDFMINEHDSDNSSGSTNDSSPASDDDPSDDSASDPDVRSDTEIKDLLFEAIDNIKSHSAGIAASSGLLPGAANPGIYVDGLGGIGLPLSEHDARRLAEKSSRLPVETQFDSFVETTSGNIWELGSPSFELRNPAWRQTLNAAMVKVATSLGIAVGAAGIQAKHCRLRLYEEGSSSTCHKNHAKDPGNLGTLVIALPSAHTGGAVATYFDEERRLSQTAPSSDYDFSYVAWYADVEHSVQEVSSGYRFVLTYELIQQVPGPCQRAANLGTDKQKIVNALQRWQLAYRVDPIYWPLAYVLDNKYDEADLRSNRLKGQDSIKAHCLKQVCDANGFSFFLANIEQAISGSCDNSYNYDNYDHYGGRFHNEDDEHHSIIDEDNRTLKLEIVTLENGSVCAKDVDFEMDNMLQADPFDGEEPDNEDTIDDSTTHYYRGSVLLVMPRDMEDKMLFESALHSTEEARKFLDGLLKPVQDIKLKRTTTAFHAPPHGCQSRLENFCKQVMGHWKVYENSIYEDVVTAAVLLDRPSLFLMVAQTTKYTMSSAMYRKIGEVLSFELSEPLDWQKGIATAAQKSQRISQIWSALSLVLEGFKNSLESSGRTVSSGSNSIKDWMYSTLTASLEVSLPMDAQDSKILLEIAQEHPQREQYLFQAVLPYVKKHMVNIDSPLLFLGAVFDSYKENNIRKEVAINLYCDILNDLIPEWLKIQELLSVPKKTNYGAPHSYGGGRTALLLPRCPEPSDMVALLDQCSSLGLRNEFHNILCYVMDSSELSPIGLFGSKWIPFLQIFLHMFGSNLTQPSSGYRETFHVVISNYIRRYLGQEPPAPVMTTAVRLGCGHCGPCDQLDRFLLNSEKETDYFKYSKPIRDHVERQIRGRYKTSTDRRGSPQTLVVTKNEAEYKAKRAVTDYEERCRVVRRNIEDMGIPMLNDILGTTGNELIDFRSVRNKLIAAGRFRVPLADVTQPTNAIMPPWASTSPKATEDGARVVLEID
ncbi:hypothetical protein MMC17_006999 [Xylographa soralifera]|nr:hypothetical protein [Xylographa soralifera]